MTYAYNVHAVRRTHSIDRMVGIPQSRRFCLRSSPDFVCKTWSCELCRLQAPARPYARFLGEINYAAVFLRFSALRCSFLVLLR